MSRQRLFINQLTVFEYILTDGEGMRKNIIIIVSIIIALVLGRMLISLPNANTGND